MTIYHKNTYNTEYWLSELQHFIGYRTSFKKMLNEFTFHIVMKGVHKKSLKGKNVF